MRENNIKPELGSACSKPGLKGERRLFVLLILVEFLPSLLTFFSQSVFCIMCWDIQISFMHKLRAVIVVILFTDISVFNNENMLFRPFGFLAPKDV